MIFIYNNKMDKTINDMMEKMIGKDCVDIIYKYLHNMKMSDIIIEFNEKKDLCAECGIKKMQLSWMLCDDCGVAKICDECVPEIVYPTGYIQCIRCDIMEQHIQEHFSELYEQQISE
jgi:hypothetical protein